MGMFNGDLIDEIYRTKCDMIEYIYSYSYKSISISIINRYIYIWESHLAILRCWSARIGSCKISLAASFDKRLFQSIASAYWGAVENMSGIYMELTSINHSYTYVVIGVVSQLIEVITKVITVITAINNSNCSPMN